MSFKRTTAINKIKALKKKIKVIQGGTYAGKTYAIIPILIDLASKNYYPQGITVVAQTIPSVKEGALKIFKNIMNETNRWNDNSYNKTDREYTFWNGTVVKFTAYEDAGKAKQAGKRDILFINEANYIDWAIADELIGRSDVAIFIDYNPNSTFWVHESVIPDPQSEFLSLTYLDNEGLPESQYERLMYRKRLAEQEEKSGNESNKHRNWWNVYGLGKIGKIEGLCFPDVTIINEIPRNAELLGYGMDFGYTNDPSTIVACYRNGNNLYFDELLYQTGLMNKDLKSKAKKAKVDFGTVTVADNDQSKIDELRYTGEYWYIKPTKKFPNSVAFGINFLNEYNIHLTARSHNGIRESNALKWDVDKNGKALNKPVPGNDHFWDAARYIAQYKLSYKFQ